MMPLRLCASCIGATTSHLLNAIAAFLEISKTIDWTKLLSANAIYKYARKQRTAKPQIGTACARKYWSVQWNLMESPSLWTCTINIYLIPSLRELYITMTYILRLGRKCLQCANHILLLLGLWSTLILIKLLLLLTFVILSIELLKCSIILRTATLASLNEESLRMDAYGWRRKSNEKLKPEI